MKFFNNRLRNMKQFLCCLAILSMTTTLVYAQSNSNSPYSQYGFGDLTDQSVGFNKGMGGVGIAFRKGNEVNPLNPASYSAIDSITMIFDAGMSGQITNFSENGKKVNAKSGGFDYVVGSLRLIKDFGISFGIMPFSNIGFEYEEDISIDDIGSMLIAKNNGNGGLNQFFVGAGWQIFKSLSVGFNASYLWGDINRTISVVNSSSINALYREYTASVSNYKLDFGVQYLQPIGKNDQLTLGLVFSPGHKLNSDPSCKNISLNSSLLKADTTAYSINNGMELPTTFGVGLAYQRGLSLRLGADFQLQKWGSVDYPYFDNNSYQLKSGLLKDSYKMNVGAEWIPNPRSTRSLLHHLRYRIGAGYTTPYYYINGQDGPKDYHISVGLGIPIMNAYNNRSILNISAQWQHRSAESMLTENTFRLNIGLTFNERWFSKWKVE